MAANKGIRLLCATLIAAWGSGVAPAAVPSSSLLVIAHEDTPALNEDALKRIYEGKLIQIDGRAVIPVNLKPGSQVRKDFMERILAQDDDKFIAYWTVRRYIGKGSPPQEFASVEQQVEFIRRTPGAVGYVDASVAVAPGLKTIMTKP
jgi:hypothetical protein